MNGNVLIEPAELKTAMQSEPMVIIDTRDPSAYAKGHIPGAVNLRDVFTYLATSDPDGLAEVQGKFADAFGAVGLSGKETAVIYEDSMNTGFGQSCRGYFLLKYLGYPKARVLHGGYQAWVAEDMPTDTLAANPVPAASR
jgi:thiosulfate/3-mercaptopyruvate sulfurtransferase